MRTLFLACVASCLLTCSAIAEDVLMRDDFDSLDLWKPLTFPKIHTHTVYEIVKDGSNSILKAFTSAAASGLTLKKTFNVKEYPVVAWRWKVDRVFDKGDATKKTGDDYPARVYIIFEYDPKKAGFGTRAKYGLAKKLYGEYPPHSSLNYIWANRKHDKAVIESPYTSLSRMIPLRSGADSAGEWAVEKVDVLADYKKAFGKEPPEKASLAIMSDSDNTAEKATAYFDYIEVSARGPKRKDASNE